MLILRLWNYLRGYVIILVEGYFIEKFLNVCTHRQILLWDIKRHKDCVISMKISIRGFRLLRPVAKKTKCRVRIVKKRGLPFLLNRYRKRKTFFAGAFLFILLIYIMTSFVWSVEITGNKELNTSFIENALSSNGIRPGVLKYRINTDKTVTKMMLEVKELSWISIDVHGTKVKVQLKERALPPDLVTNNIPCNIVVVKDGFVKQIIVTDGIEAVQEGDTVKKGQILISGQIPIKNEKDKFRLVHAMGSVKARTWYEEINPVVTNETEKVRTGKEINQYSVVLFTWKIDLFHKKIDLENYDREEARKKLTVGEDLVFPFEWITQKYYETSIMEKKVSEEEARRAAADAAYKKLMERIPPNADIIKTDVKYIEDEDEGPLARVTFECIEDIGISEKIGGN